MQKTPARPSVLPGLSSAAADSRQGGGLTISAVLRAAVFIRILVFSQGPVSVLGSQVCSTVVSPQSPPVQDKGAAHPNHVAKTPTFRSLRSI